jgi:serine phosphatase RsbU (regulator of sigma subunit)
MNLRLRLIVAFFLLSVVPLGAVTFFTYTSNAQAMRQAAAREAELLAGELSQRMQVVTTQLSERVGHLIDVAEVREASRLAVEEAARRSAAEAAVAASTETTPAPDVQVAQALGEMAMLLNNIELRGLRGSRPPPDGRGGPPRFGGNGRRSGGRPEPPPDQRGEAPPSLPDRRPGVRPEAAGMPAAPAGDTTPRPQPSTRDAAPAEGLPMPPPGPSPPSGLPPAPVPGEPDPMRADRILIDIGPMRRDIVRQIVPEGQWEQLSPEDRQRVIAEVNQRMLGIAQGIQLGAAEAQKRIAEAQRTADAKAREAAAAVAPAAAPRPSAPARRRTALSGSRLGVTVERDGKVVHAVNAELNLPNLLATVFATTRRDRGEVPFAVGKDGKLYTASDEDRRRIEAIGGGIVNAETPPGTVRIRDWIVVSTADPTGSGLKFGIARPVGDSLAILRRTSARNAGLGLAFIGLALIGIVPVSSGLTRNLSKLSDAVMSIAHGDYRARVQVRSHDEIGRLAAAFNQMAEDVERHQRAAVEQERIKRELELGRQIQNDMQPRAPLQLGLTEIKGVSVPAREVGGDFFNYFALEDGRIAVLVGDVSGKGVGAALLMANIQASLRTRLGLGQTLDAMASEIDLDIERSTRGSLYATLFVGILDPVSRQLAYVNAGHHPQYILRGREPGTGVLSGGVLERMTSSGLPVGLLAGRGYSEACVQLAAGDLLFFYTDGCVEAENDQDEVFGAERLEQLLASLTGADDVLVKVETEVKAFRGAREPFDDATMMVVRVG